MRISIQLFSLVSLVFLSQTIRGMESVPRVKAEKEKEYHQTFLLEKGDDIMISNQFGDITIELWNEPKIQVDVEIVARAKTAERAQAMLDMISINGQKTGKHVVVETEIKKGKKLKNKGNNNQEFHIDYQIKMPNHYTLELNNQFGEILIPDFDGQIDLKSQFGKVYAGLLSKVDKIDVQFGSLILDRMHDGEGTIQFSTMEIGELSGNIHLKLAFCNRVEIRTSGNLTALDLDLNNSDLDFEVPTNLSASFDIRTSFGSFKNGTDFQIKSEAKGDYDFNFDERFEGQSGDGKTPIDIKANFSKVRLEHK